MASREDHTDALALATQPGSDDPLAGAPDDSLDRSERVIAISRLVLAVAAFGIMLMDS